MTFFFLKVDFAMKRVLWKFLRDLYLEIQNTLWKKKKFFHFYAYIELKLKKSSKYSPFMAYLGTFEGLGKYYLPDPCKNKKNHYIYQRYMKFIFLQTLIKDQCLIVLTVIFLIILTTATKYHSEQYRFVR